MHITVKDRFGNTLTDGDGVKFRSRVNFRFILLPGPDVSAFDAI